MQQYFLLTGRQLEPLPPKPVLSDFYVNQSFFDSIIGNTTERTTAKLITFYKMHSGLGLLISKAQVGSYVAIANDNSSLIPKPDSKFPSSKLNCTDLNKWHVISVTWAIGKDPSNCWCNAEKLITFIIGANNIYYKVILAKCWVRAIHT